MKIYVCLQSLSVCLLTAGSAFGATLLSDDLSSGANFTTMGGTADSTADFGFDYSTVGIPAAPGAIDTLGLRVATNVNTGVSSYFAVLTNASFSGAYTVEFDMWLNYTGPLLFGDTGTTEFGGGVIGHDGVYAANASGATLTFTGNAGSDIDIVAYEDGTRQTLADGGFNPILTGLNHPNIDTELGLFPEVAAPAAQVALFPTQTGLTRYGAAGFAWHHFVIIVDEGAGTAEYNVDGVHVVTHDANDGRGFNPSGRAGFLYTDPWPSVALVPDMQFGLFDNFLITETVDPLLGDLDGDGFVGITDLSAILSNWNATVAAGDLLAGDPSNDGFVGIEDLNFVLGNWNTGTPPTSTTNIPEPGTIVLVILGGLMIPRRMLT